MILKQIAKEIADKHGYTSSINANKETQTLTVVFQNIKLVGNIEHDGMFTNTNGIKSNSDITDKNSSMQAIREKYNFHTHTGNQGNPTSSPRAQM